MPTTPTTSDRLASGSAVRLFGRLIEGVTIDSKKLAASISGGTKLLSNQPNGDVHLARIYAFSFEGQFHTLPRPTLFLVQGVGADAKTDTGLAEISNVCFEAGIMVWLSDTDDVVLRGDIVIGTIDDVLIDATLSSASKYPIISRGEMAARGEAIARGEMISRGEMIARNRLQQ